MFKLVSLYIVLISDLSYAAGNGLIFRQATSVWVWASFGFLLLSILVLYIASKNFLKANDIYKKNKKLEMRLNTTITKDNTLRQEMQSKAQKVMPNKKNGLNTNVLMDTTEALIRLLMLKTNKIKLNNREFSLVNVLNEVEGSILDDMSDRNKALVLDIDKDISTYLIGDSDNVGTVLSILLRHAIRYDTYGKSVKLTITKKENNILRFRIDNNSSKEHMIINSDDIDRYTKAQLFLAQELIELMGGKLKISESDKYGLISEFDLTIIEWNIQKKTTQEKSSTISHQANVYKDEIIATPNITMSSFASFARMKLLVVEDNIINQKVLINVLSKSMIDISIAKDGQEAVIMVLGSGKEFDFILMDINMPIMDGYEATKRIREHKRFHDLPIVALTALVQKKQIENMYKSGINAYLNKPLNVAKLYTAFSMFIEIDHTVDMSAPSHALHKTSTEGLDIGCGLKNAKQNEEQYRKLLNEFVITYSETDEMLDTLARQKRYDEMTIVCDDMKIITSTIGAYNLEKSIDIIIEEIKKGPSNFSFDCIVDYKTEVQKLNKAISSYL